MGRSNLTGLPTIKTMENQKDIKKAKYRILWKSTKIQNFYKSPFVFERDRAEAIVKYARDSERIQELLKIRAPGKRTQFIILKDSRYDEIEVEIDEIETVRNIEDLKDQLKLIRLKGL